LPYEEAVVRILTAIRQGNLIFLAGAGISVSSGLPTAAQLARRVRERAAISGSKELASFGDDIEQIARHFYLPENRGRFLRYFLRDLIGRTTFNGPCNAAHMALADFLMASIAQGVVTTNVDRLIEEAAQQLSLDGIATALDGTDLQQNEPTLLKLHGCWYKDMENTVWCAEQAESGTVIHDRLAASEVQLKARWTGRTIVIAGFWTDWEYLNQIFAGATLHLDADLVVVIDIAAEEQLKARADGLWQWIETQQWCLLQGSAVDTLDTIRKKHGRMYLEELYKLGTAQYRSRAGSGVAIPEPPFEGMDSGTFYGLRCDSEGVPYKSAAKSPLPTPDSGPVGSIHLELLARGARVDGGVFILRDKRVRVIKAHPGEPIAFTKDRFHEDLVARRDTDTVIAVGAVEDGGAAENVFSEGREPTVARPSVTVTWVPTVAALEEVTT
jgi:NAD-dependent SIR2 family protein deacetylase